MFIAFTLHFPKQPQLELEPNTSLSCIMAHGCALSDNLCGAILNMARTLDVHSIVEYTGCKCRTVEWILLDYRKKGTVLCKHLAKELRGVKRSLRPSYVKVCYNIHSRTWAWLRFVGGWDNILTVGFGTFPSTSTICRGFPFGSCFPSSHYRLLQNRGMYKERHHN